MSLTFAGMMLGFLVDVLIAANLGTGQMADALIVALTLPILTDTVFRQGARHSMIPLFTEMRSLFGTEEFRRFVSGLLNLGSVLGVIVVVIIEITAPWIIPGLAPGLTLEGKAYAVFLLRLCAPLIIFVIGNTVWGVLLNSHRRFALVALRNVFTPGIVLCSILLSQGSDNMVFFVAAAYTIGFAAFFGVLMSASKQIGHRHVWTAWLSIEDLSRLKNATLLVTLGFVLRHGLRILERLLASLVAVGGVSSYYFAFRLLSASQALIGGSIATTGLPGMTEYDIKGDKEGLSRVLQKNLKRTLILVLPLFLIVTIFHQNIISTVYGRGGFDDASIHTTSQILFYLGFGLIFFCLGPVLQSGLYAQRAYALVFRNAATITMLSIVLALVFSQIWGLQGIAVAASLSSGCSTINLIYLLKKTGVNLFGLASKRSISACPRKS